jgi:predicted RNA-binding protein with PIN domain
MAYLIDGNNLLGKVAPCELRSKDGRGRLTARLLAFQKVTRTRIHLVFDGGSDPETTTERLSEKVTVYFPGQGRSADDLILEMLAGLTDRRRFFLVSSDSRLREAARKAGVASIRSEEFARELGSALKVRRKQKELEKHVRAPSPLELDLWEDFFRSRK